MGCGPRMTSKNASTNWEANMQIIHCSPKYDAMPLISDAWLMHDLGLCMAHTGTNLLIQAIRSCISHASLIRDMTSYRGMQHNQPCMTQYFLLIQHNGPCMSEPVWWHFDNYAGGTLCIICSKWANQFALTCPVLVPQHSIKKSCRLSNNLGFPDSST
jgi:hypothetical protein